MTVVRYRPPAAPLRPFITTYYWVSVPDDGRERRDWLHPEWCNLRFVLEGRWTACDAQGWARVPPSSLFGPTDRATGVTGSSPGRVVGVGLLPVGLATLFDAEAAELAGRVLALDRFDPQAETLRARLAAADGEDEQALLLDAHFAARLEARPAAPALFRQAHAALLDPETATVEEFAHALQVSPRHLLRLCRRLFGFPPKLLLRRQRFLRTLEAAFAAPDRPFAEVLDGAYCDQSHFVRDFRRFMGFGPREYFALERPLLGVAQRQRMAALGASFQDLHAQRLGLRLPRESVSSKPGAPERA